MHDVDSVAPYPCRKPVSGNFWCSSRMISGDIGADPEEKILIIRRRPGRYLSTTGSRTMRIRIGGTSVSSWI